MNDADTSPWDKRRPSQVPRLPGNEPPPKSPTPHGPLGHPTLPVDGGDTPPPTSGRRAMRTLGIATAVAVAIAAVVGIGFALRSSQALDVEQAARSVVLVSAPGCDWSGSGTLVSDSGLILTNSHVATDNGVDRCELQVAFTESFDEEPREWYSAAVVADDVAIDLAVLQILGGDGAPMGVSRRTPVPLDNSTPNPGDEIQTLGYPGVGGSTVTFTSGDFSGVTSVNGSEYYKTTASMNSGVSGGAAFNGSFALVGVPTAGRGGDVVCEQGDCASVGTSIGLIRPIRYAEELIEQGRENAGNL